MIFGDGGIGYQLCWERRNGVQDRFVIDDITAIVDPYLSRRSESRSGSDVIRSSAFIHRNLIDLESAIFGVCFPDRATMSPIVG